MSEPVEKNSTKEAPEHDRDLPTLLLLLLLAVIVFGIFLFDFGGRTNPNAAQNVREKVSAAYSVAESEIPKVSSGVSDFFRYVAEYPGSHENSVPVVSVLPTFPPVSTPPSIESELPSPPALEEAVLDIIHHEWEKSETPVSFPVIVEFWGYSFEFSWPIPEEGVTLSLGPSRLSVKPPKLLSSE